MQRPFSLGALLVLIMSAPSIGDQLILGGGPSQYSNIINSGGQIAQFFNVYDVVDNVEASADISILRVWVAGNGSGTASLQLNKIDMNDPLSGSVVLSTTFPIPNTGLSAANTVPIDISINQVLSNVYAFTIMPLGGTILMEGSGTTYQDHGGTGQVWIRNSANDPWAIAIVPPASNPMHFSLYGTPTPEPTSTALLLVGTMLANLFRHR